MTATIKSAAYTFDFTAEANRAMAAHAVMHAKTLFVSFNNKSGDMRDFIVASAAHSQLMQDTPDIWGEASSYLEKYRKADSCLALRHTAHDAYSIIYSEASHVTQIMAGQNEEELKAFIFDHEKFHILIPNAMGGEHIPPHMTESYADGGGAVQQIQRFGQKGKDIAEYVAWYRLHDSLQTGKSKYMTSPVIDAVTDNITPVIARALSPEETVEIITDMVNKHAFPESDLEQAMQAWSHLKGKISTDDLARNSNVVWEQIMDTALNTAHPATFYIGARLMTPLLQPGGFQAGKHIIKMPGTKQKAYARKLANRAKAFGMEGLYQKLEQYISPAPQASTHAEVKNVL
ncbi:MAG: hypothetical protein OXT65_00720 [Alphaproteobacteria bacterium]|nr:hypothetical protein [Alphaproteobacteria bacterium]